MNDAEQFKCFAPAVCAERLARIETKLDALLQARDDQERRIRSLERRDAYVLGVCAVISMIAPFLVKKFFGI